MIQWRMKSEIADAGPLYPMNARPSIPGSGSIGLMVAPGHALIAGDIRTASPTAAKVKVVVPETA